MDAQSGTVKWQLSTGAPLVSVKGSQEMTLRGQGGERLTFLPGWNGQLFLVVNEGEARPPLLRVFHEDIFGLSAKAPWRAPDGTLFLANRTDRHLSVDPYTGHRVAEGTQGAAEECPSSSFWLDIVRSDYGLHAARSDVARSREKGKGQQPMELRAARLRLQLRSWDMSLPTQEAEAGAGALREMGLPALAATLNGTLVASREEEGEEVLWTTDLAAPPVALYALAGDSLFSLPLHFALPPSPTSEGQHQHQHQHGRLYMHVQQQEEEEGEGGGSFTAQLLAASATHPYLASPVLASSPAAAAMVLALPSAPGTSTSASSCLALTPASPPSSSSSSPSSP